MKFLIVLALALVGAIAAPHDDTDVAADVAKIINEILDALSEPLLDLHGLTANIDLDFEQLDFKSIDVVLSGIKNLEITTLTYDKTTGRLDYELTLGKVDLDIEFDLLLSGALEAENEPVIDLELDDLKFTGYAVVDTDSDPHKVTDFDLLITLDGTKTKLKGILNDDDLTEKLTKVLDEQLPAIVNDIALQLEPEVSPIIKSIINIIIRVTS